MPCAQGILAMARAFVSAHTQGDRSDAFGRTDAMGLTQALVMGNMIQPHNCWSRLSQVHLGEPSKCGPGTQSAARWSGT